MLKDLTTPRLCRSKKRMSASTRRVFGGNKAALHTNSSERKGASNSGQHFEWSMTMLLIGRQDGSGIQSNRETCRILRLRRPRHGKIPHGKIGIHGGVIFKTWRRAVSDFCCENNMQFRTAGPQYLQFDGECTQNTHPQRASRTLQSSYKHGLEMRACGSRSKMVEL